MNSNYNTNKIEIKGRSRKWTNHGWNEVICTRMHRGVEYEAMYESEFIMKKRLKKYHIEKMKKSTPWEIKGKKGTQEHMREMKWKWIKSRDRVKKKQRLNGSRERKGEGKEMTRNKRKWSVIKGKKEWRKWHKTWKIGNQNQKNVNTGHRGKK